MDAHAGYLDRLYVRHDRQGRGVASALLRDLERFVGGPSIVTHASVTALPFFSKRGYEIVKERGVVRRGLALTNYLRAKRVR